MKDGYSTYSSTMVLFWKNSVSESSLPLNVSVSVWLASSISSCVAPVDFVIIYIFASPKIEPKMEYAAMYSRFSLLSQRRSPSMAFPAV